MLVSAKEMLQKAKEGKYAAKTVVKNGVRSLLCATPLAYEDDLCEKVRDCFNLMSDIFGIKLSEEDRCDNLEDYVSEVRDEIINRFERLVKGRIIYGYVEY